MTPTEMRHVLEAAYHAVFPDSDTHDVSRFEFGVAVGIVLGALPLHEFGALDARTVKGIVKNLAAQCPSYTGHTGGGQPS